MNKDLHIFKTVRNKRGQTSVEYLLLMAVAFITAYIMITGPVANFTSGMLQTFHNNIHNVVTTGEMTEGSILNTEDSGHPSDMARLQPLHL